MTTMTDADFVAMESGRVRDTAIPRFYEKDYKMNAASLAAGHSVYEKREYVEILTPGTKSNPDRPVIDADKARWPAQYQAFKNGKVLAIDGMPLEKWTLADVAQVEFLKHWNIRTVEQLARLTDAQIQNLGTGGRQLVTSAKLWLEQAKDNSGISRVVAENELLKNRQQTLENQLAEQSAQIRALAAKGGEGGVISSAPAAMSADAMATIAAMVAAQMAAAAPPKNKGGRPPKAKAETPEHELPGE